MDRFYKIGTAMFILQAMQAFSVVDRLAYGEWDGKPGDKFTQLVNLLLWSTCAALFMKGCRQLRTVRTGAYLMFGFVFFIFVSAAWSVMPATSIREAVFYLFAVLGSLGIATTYDSDDFMELVGKLSASAAIASLILLVVDRSAALGALGQDFPDFRGVFSQKNNLGQAMAIGAVGCLHGIRIGRARLRNILQLILVTILALMSKSATSMLAIVTFCTIDAVIFMIRKGGLARMFAVVIIAFGAPFILVTLVAPDAFLETIGKDPTLTGRTEIWAFVIPDILQRPMLGWGYLAFWNPDNPAAREISDTVHWTVPQAHNGVLEILLSVGFIGGSYILFLFLRVFRLSIRCIGTHDSAIAISCFLICSGLLLIGTSETVLVIPFEASTIMFLTTGFFCERALRAPRRRVRRYNPLRQRLESPDQVSGHSVGAAALHR
jgi:exopolysaccharide production protein ExoQ